MILCCIISYYIMLYYIILHDMYIPHAPNCFHFKGLLTQPQSVSILCVQAPQHNQLEEKIPPAAASSFKTSL